MHEAARPYLDALQHTSGHPRWAPARRGAPAMVMLGPASGLPGASSTGAGARCAGPLARPPILAASGYAKSRPDGTVLLC